MTVIGGFNSGEYHSRVAALQRSMKQHDLHAVLFTTEHEIRYYSGFFTQFWQSPTRPWFLLIPRSGEPVAVIPGIGEALMKRSCVGEIRCWSSPHPTDDGVSLLAATLLEMVGQHGRVGLLKGRETTLRMPLADYENLLSQTGHTQFVDVTEIVQRQRQIKSAAEIDKITVACNAAGDAFDNVPRRVVRGDSLRTVFRKFKQDCLAAGADDISYLVGSAAAGGYDDIIAPPSDRPTCEGDVLILDTGCVYDGYFCDYDRNFAFGHADTATRTAYRKVHDSIDAALAIVRPGISCADLHRSMNQVLDPVGTSDSGSVGRFGHGLGMQLTESPSITAWDQTTLVEGMVMTLEPGLAYGDGKMMVHEENIVIEADGARLLSRRASAEIVIIDP